MWVPLYRPFRANLKVAITAVAEEGNAAPEVSFFISTVPALHGKPKSGEYPSSFRIRRALSLDHIFPCLMKMCVPILASALGARANSSEELSPTFSG